MSVDIQRITDLMWYLNIVWKLPIQITLAIYVLHMNLGLGSLAALGAMLVVMLCNIPLTRIQKRYQSKIMEAKDDRMRTTSEVLWNMKTIKLQAWADQFLGKHESLREKEYNKIWKSLTGRLSGVPELDKPTLDDINLKVRSGMKVAICGTVGSGKSSLLSCILGEMKKVSGQVKVSGTKAYVPHLHGYLLAMSGRTSSLVVPMML
ncbi:hypothetical protein MLD38_035580 [Melastoma candidum]|uniref:Uncharacterized protein n=1 Tax=Melastoma candidum TaxID=119954 RepID=A0ACB9LH16_9MYRT|nr:hypothetical protein MLD38_035580 [Melastoma candidum]